jgi:hypothetical protein
MSGVLRRAHRSFRNFYLKMNQALDGWARIRGLVTLAIR